MAMNNYFYILYKDTLEIINSPINIEYREMIPNFHMEVISKAEQE